MKPRWAKPQINPCKVRVLRALAEDMDDSGFQSDADDVRAYVRSEEARAGWNSLEEFLGALKSDVWWHYGHVGDEDEKHIYDAAERRIDEAFEAVRKCGR